MKEEHNFCISLFKQWFLILLISILAIQQIGLGKWRMRNERQNALNDSI